jgi:hypothetical protein
MTWRLTKPVFMSCWVYGRKAREGEDVLEKSGALGGSTMEACRLGRGVS